jgi:hypothetical protein
MHDAVRPNIFDNLPCPLNLDSAAKTVGLVCASMWDGYSLSPVLFFAPIAQPYSGVGARGGPFQKRRIT